MESHDDSFAADFEPFDVDEAAFLSPLTLQDSLDAGARAAARLLTLERWHDGLERRKADDRIPRAVERITARNLLRAQRDIDALVSALVDAATEAHAAGVLDQMVPYTARQLTRVGERNVGELLREGRAALASSGRVPDEALPEDLLNLTIEHFDLDAATISGDDDSLLFRHPDGEHHLTSSRGTLPLIDGTTFVSRRLASSITPAAPDRPYAVSGPYAATLATAAELSMAHARRVTKTTSEGVQVEPTGIAFLVVLGIIVAVLVIVGILCVLGKGLVCAVAITVAVLGLMVFCAVVFGGPCHWEWNGTGDGGIDG